LPWPTLVAVAPALLSARASRDLLRHAGNPQQLAPAIQQTIAAACLSGLLLAISLVAWRWFS
jgi:1,4-dihydroxy-2-naphthoate polyprenyltransferase